MLGTCHHCEFVSPQPWVGKAFCLHDANNPVEITIRSENLYCPAGKFKLGLGDVLALLFKWLGITRIVIEWHRLTRHSITCGCHQRRANINARWRGLKLWMDEWVAL